MRFSPSRALYTGSLACLALLLYRIFKAPNQPCDLPAKHLERLALLVKEVHLVLESLRLTHALCFESLLGQVRVGRQLPWERGASVCIKEEEVLRHSEQDLAAAFSGAGLSVAWDSGEGRYLVESGSQAKVNLVVYSGRRELQEVSEPMLHRVGWRRTPLPAHCEFSLSLACIPARLLQPPLSYKHFGSAGDVPVPREGAEMLKYQFPDSWWKDSRPAHC